MLRCCPARCCAGPGAETGHAIPGRADRRSAAGPGVAAGHSLLCLYEGTLHGEGPAWEPGRNRLVWFDVPNRRLLAWHPDGHVEVAVDCTFFMNGNALEASGALVHCEHGRRCISRSEGDAEATPIVTHYEGRRLNSPNDVAAAADGAIWFTDPTFGIPMPSQGSLMTPELDHRSVYRFDPASGALRAKWPTSNSRTAWPSHRTAARFTCLTPRCRWTRSPKAKPGRPTGSSIRRCARWRLDRPAPVLSTDHGYPDGFAVDRRGWVWASAADGIHVVASGRGRLGYIPTPMTASNCTFGSPDGRRLFIAATELLLAIDLAE